MRVKAGLSYEIVVEVQGCVLATERVWRVGAG